MTALMPVVQSLLCRSTSVATKGEAVSERTTSASVWDVIVVGAGPAGSAAALSALQSRPDARVLMIDREDFPRDKSCGDGIAPQVLDVLEQLGVPDVVGDFRPVHRLSIGYPAGTGASTTGLMRRPARIVPRSVLDARLVVAAIAAGAQLVRATVRRVDVRPDKVVLDAQWHGRVVIGADGAESLLRRRLGLARNAPAHLALAIRGYAPVRADLGDEQYMVLSRGDWPAYAWSFPIGDGIANIGYGQVLRGAWPVTRQSLLDRLDLLLPGAARDAHSWRAHHLPLSSGRPRQPDGRVLLVGDALSLINPLSGEGIYYAVVSGAVAGAAALTTGDPGSTYRTALQRQLGQHLRHTALTASLARRPWLVDAAIGGTRQHPRAFDDVVELGLGQGLLTPRVVGTIISGLRR